ncbi:protein tyrosine phosphatase [Oceanisphaera profunda]|uniref:protein-tyrosine-phosphatase n=1 Tax=Oceanisphaera profunda TaxID=1416627 RepID=A0A1Y0D2P4_9GAMM|nr:low molecular weight protein-tyrosine-phosphatase [Oceanisphaera profunda]ART81793.1 protein tyrosine phosphatase [Oceanisphaera profunda]
MFDNILVVCVGNICRSPTAEFLLKQALPNKTVHSAGLGALVGHDIDATAKKIAEQHNVACPTHSARQLTKELCREADVILVMEQGHKESITRLAPEARGKTFLLGQWNSNQEIPDPYKKSEEAFQHVYQLIANNSKLWAEKLAK